MTHRLGIILLFAVCFSATAHGAPAVVVARKPSLTCPKTEMGDAGLQGRYERMWKQYSESVEEATKTLQAELEKQTKSATGSGNLDLALFWQGLEKQYDQTGELLWDDSSQKKTWKERFGDVPYPMAFGGTVKKASEAYASAMQDLEKAYEELVTELTKAERLDDAVKVRREGNKLLAVEASASGSETAPRSLREHRADRQKLVSSGGGNASSEASVDTALKWLMLHQQDDGGWSFATECDCRNACHPSCRVDRAGATGLALLPFLARGYTEKDGPYKKQLGKAVGFLAELSNKNQGNLIRDGGTISSHAYALIALNEFGELTGRKELNQPIQMALMAVVQADKNGPGWSSTPSDKPDMLTTASVIAGVTSLPSHGTWKWSPQHSLKRAVAFLDQVQYDDRTQYGLFAPEDCPPAGTSTSAGLASRLTLGWNKENPALRKGASSVAKKGPSDDILYDYYATNIMYALKGDMWVAWNSRMRERLVMAQSRDGHSAGSWLEGFDKSQDAQRMGRLYVTALATLILEVYYRYPGL